MAKKSLNEQIEMLDKRIAEAEDRKQKLTKRIAEMKAQKKELLQRQNAEFFKEIEKMIVDSGLTSEMDKSQIKSLLSQMANK